MPSGMTHPKLESVKAVEASEAYAVTLREPDGTELTWHATIVEMPAEVGLGVTFNPGPSPDEPWAGDAESIRSIVAAVLAVHRARHYGR